MTNELLRNSVSNVVPEWQHPVLPGHATQGNILLTTTDFVNPPQSSANFIWMAMEDIIGVANMKIEYDNVTSAFHLYKAKGHLNGDESWDYLWEEVGNWTGLSEEAEEAIKSLMYVGYEFIQEGNGMIVNGIQKDGVKVELIRVNFVDKTYVDQADETLRNLINNEVTRATNRENELEEMIKRARPLGGIATDTTADGENGTKINVRFNKGLAVDADNRLNVEVNEGLEVDGITNKVNVKYDNDTIKLDSNNTLYSDDVRDDLNTSSKYTYSIDKIKSLLTSSMIYMGSVQTRSDLPTDYTTDDRGKVWNIIDSGINVAWTGTEWDDLGGMYTEGNGIKIENNEIAARVDTSKGLGFDSQHRIFGNIDTTKGLQFQANGKMEVKLDPEKGIDFDSEDGKIKTKIDTDKGLQFDSTDGSIEVKVDSTKGLKFDSTSGEIQINAGSGLQFNQETGKLEGTPLEFSAGDGLEVVDVGTPDEPEKKINIRANFTLDPSPLGDRESNLTIYSDNKIGVKTDVAVIPYLAMNASQIAAKVPSSLNWNLSGRAQCIVFSLVKGDFTVLNTIPASDISKYTYIAVCTRALTAEPPLLTINKGTGVIGEYTFGLNGMDTFIRPLPYPANSAYEFSTAMAGLAGVREAGIVDGTTPLVQGILTYHQLSSGTPGNQNLDINNVKASVPSNITIYAFPKGNQ